MFQHPENLNLAGIGFVAIMALFVIVVSVLTERLRHRDDPKSQPEVQYTTPPPHEHMIDALRSPMYTDRTGALIARCCVVGCSFKTQIGRGLPTASLQDDGRLSH